MAEVLSRAHQPTYAAAVREAISQLRPSSDGSFNDLDRLTEDLELQEADRIRLAQVLRSRLGGDGREDVVLRASIVAEVMVALD